MTDIQNECCNAQGVTCDRNTRVTSISWPYLSLDGILNASSLPPMLSLLDLSGNALTGDIRMYEFPSSLTFLNVSSTALTGAFPALPSSLLVLDLSRNSLNCNLKSVVWPTGLVELYVNNLGCVGDLPVFPESLKKLVIGKSGDNSNLNRFTGTLQLNSPILLQINDNWITDLQIYDSSHLASCDLSNTPLLQNPISNLTVCTKTGLFSDGQSFGCTSTEPTAYYRYECGLLHLYETQAIAYSWNSAWQSKIVIDCVNVPFGINMAPNIVEGQAIKCTQPGNAIYRYTCGKFRLYPNPQIAASWDPNWNAYQVYDCVGLSTGTYMSLKGQNDNSTSCSFNYCPIRNATALAKTKSTIAQRVLTFTKSSATPTLSTASTASKMRLDALILVPLSAVLYLVN